MTKKLTVRENTILVGILASGYGVNTRFTFQASREHVRNLGWNS